jgi:hypothetical protein
MHPDIRRDLPRLSCMTGISAPPQVSRSAHRGDGGEVTMVLAMAEVTMAMEDSVMAMAMEDVTVTATTALVARTRHTDGRTPAPTEW